MMKLRLLATLCLSLTLSGVFAAEPFHFVVFGDNQQAQNSVTSGVQERYALPRVIRDRQPAFVAAVGDLMDRAEKPGAYGKFAEYNEPFLSEIPFFPTLGNHDALGVLAYRDYLARQLTEVNPKVYGPEAYARDFQIFREYTTPTAASFKDSDVAQYRKNVPSGVNYRTNYAFRYRNCCFISMEVGTRWWSNTPYEWLENELKRAHALPGVEHIFVILHHPIYSAAMCDNPPDPADPGKGECMMPVRQAYEPLFKKYGVTMVFAGHVHNYEHFWVPADGSATRPATDDAPRRSSYPAGGGIHYIVTGGGGGPLGAVGTRSGETSWQYRQAAMTGYHILDITVDGGTLKVDRVTLSGGLDDYKGTVSDSFTIAPKQP